ncbi:unnamed protein product [Eruca vesicaria subsp. sativa]|uniref:Uncharacterized protein n=1 Tax=Eruca vesicaria subsp. sativa TaxID=29727 RepID=A0ABC8IRT1_ERUVS|nr:unnamed protein product [Eruca vesicaria subsp. sativa]
MDYDGDGSPNNEQYTSVNAMSTEKRGFHRHSHQQIQILEAYFKECPHPNESERQKLCRDLDLEIDQIKFWFQNKRTQSKAQDERNSNKLLRGENETIQCENAVLLEALQTVTCPPCGGPPFGGIERELSLQEQRFKNTHLRRERDLLADKNKHQQTMMDSFTSVQRQQTFETLTSPGYNPNNPFERPSSSESPNIQPQLRPQMDTLQLSDTATRAVEELKRLFSTDQASLWVMSSIDGTYVIEQDSYEKFSQSVKQFRNSSACVESSRVVREVSIEATRLVNMFLDSEKWKTLFPTIVNTARTILTLGSELISQQLHILSPLVPPREFKIVRCCRNIKEGHWIIADVSLIDSDHKVSQSCYKRPSGVLIRALSNDRSKVTWIEHVEVDHRPEKQRVYQDLLSSGLGYGAKRWIVTLERMCERMTFSSATTIPHTDWGEILRTVEGRKSLMKLGERMLKNFNEMLIMPGNTEFPRKSRCGGVRISTRVNEEVGQVTGLVASAAYCLSIPSTPSQVFNLLRSNDFRHQWDVLCHGNAITETGRISTGLSETNYISLLQPTLPCYDGQNMVQEPNKTMMMLQECYMDALGGMIVYAPLDMAAMSIAASGDVDPLEIPILPSGFTISSDGQGSMGAEDGGTLLTLAFQILLSTGQNSGGRMVSENSVNEVDMVISTIVQNIKALFNLPPE